MTVEGPLTLGALASGSGQKASVAGELPLLLQILESLPHIKPFMLGFLVVLNVIVHLEASCVEVQAASLLDPLLQRLIDVVDLELVLVGGVPFLVQHKRAHHFLRVHTFLTESADNAIFRVLF